MRINPLVVLSLVCSLSQAADTVASLGDSIKATQFVTVVDHSKLINGSSKLRLSQDGVVSVGTDQSPFGNPVITIHAGSVFSADTAAHGKTFSTDLVLDYTYIDGVSGPLLIRTNGWVFVAPAGGSTFWCGPQDWPSYAFDLNNYDSESSTATLSSTDSDPSCSFSGTITITRSRGKTIPTIDHVLPGETIFKGSYNEFETKGFVNYAFKGPYPYDTTMLTLNMADIEFFGSSVGIMNPTYGGADGSYMWGIGQFWKNGYHYSLPYTDNNGSGDYTLATTSMLNGFASTTWVNSKKWDWATQVTNAPSFASIDHEHDHLTSNNGEWRLVQMDEGSAVVMPAYYYGEDNGLGVKFMPSIPIEDLHDICSTNATARIPSSMEIELDGSVSSAGYGYTMGSGNTTTFYATNKVIYAEGVVFPDTVQITFDVPFTSGRIYIYNIPILCGSKKTLVTADYIKSKVQNVNVNLQSAEDTRVALTNLITILKNL